ncbi:cellulase family glycosylhydrolase [Paenibacillus sp. Soil787]|uniref:cellulase family glycosylhydrolase n=1 Tax=Paenibacillus sp. Soil787 TaxID=1736411 RepID=UPI0007C6A9FD|nr:cellulase family glycosylhydrolase [Paenibacillus sp. Soil787]
MKTRKKLLRFTKQISTLCMSVLLLLMCAIPVAANDSAPVGAVISESPAPAPAPAPVPTGTIQDYVDAMQPGYNLGNTFDAFGGDWVQEVQDTVTQDFINEIARQGFKSIRIPTTWEWGGHTGAAPDYTVDPAWMNRIQQVVDWSLDAGLYVMINLHHDNIRWINQMPTNHDAVLAQYNALWTQIADRFKNHSNKLMFESVNEPQFVNVDNAKQNELLDELNTSFFHIVRASGGANDVRPLVLPTLVTNGVQLDMDYLASTMAKLNDKNLIATIHFYGFWPFGINIAGYSTFEHNGDTAKDIDGLAARAYNTFIAKGVPVVIGEFGVFGWDSWGAGDDVPEKGEANKFFEYSTYVFKQNKMTHMLWDNTSRFDRSTYKWNDQDTYNYIMAGLEGRSSTAESDLIFIKKGAPAQDTVIHLNLNGNNLTGITAGNESLTAGSDYVVNGNDLVLKAGFIAKLIQSAQLGEVAVLKAHFNKGVDWTFNVMYNDTPVQQNAEGSNTNFAIPTAFNGDRLATMEAVYTKGGIAGPPNWTSYKAIAESYKLSYATNEILLTENFFKEVTSGDEVALTFYFRSGATTQYKVTKNGTSVTGAPAQKSVQTELSSLSSVDGGQSFSLNYSLKNVSSSVYGAVYGQDITIEFDKNSLEFVDAESLIDGIQIAAMDVTEGKVRILLFSPGLSTGISEDGAVLKLNWKAKELLNDTLTSINVIRVQLSDMDSNLFDATGLAKTLNINKVSDKTALRAKIAEVQQLYDQAVEGNGVGQYYSGAKARLLVSLNAAKAVESDPAATTQQITDAIVALSDAVQIFHVTTGDVTGNQQVDIGDLVKAAKHYGKTSLSSDWSEARLVDVDMDNSIGLTDIVVIARKILSVQK